MTPLIDNDPAQQTRTWSAQLGTQAAQNAAPPGPFPTRLLAILEHLKQRNRAKEDAEDTLRANHFILGD